MIDGPNTSSLGLGERTDWWADMPVGTSGPQRRPVGWVVFAAAFLVPLGVPSITHTLAADQPVWWTVLSLTLLAVYCLCYMFFPAVSHRGRFMKFAFSVGMILLGLVLFTFDGRTPYVMLYATGVVMFALPPAWALIVDVSALLVVGLVLVANGTLSSGYGDLITVCSISLTLFFIARLIRAVRWLRLANQEIATLAVTAERERMARDLHDILGHSLTTITVKAGLARRVLESSGDIDRAITEIHEVEGLARSALTDVRTTVSENREVSLSAEIAGARAALRAAEIDADLPHAVDNVDPGLQRAFGYVLREAVTNVLRHSGARRVKVRLGRTWIEIEDDGAAPQAVSPGNGLRGLEERLTRIGGTIKAAACSDGGFLVRADVPTVRCE